MAFARVNGVVVHYRLAGPVDAPGLALVNALGTDARIWDGVIERLASHFRILSYDKRGHGLSSAPAGDYLIEDHVADLVALLDHLGIDRLALAGISIGGLIGQRFALDHGKQLTGLVLCDTAARIGDAALWNGRIEAISQHGLAWLADAVMARWFSEQFRREQPDALAGWQTMFERMPAVGYVGSCAALRDADLRDVIHAIAVPTLVLVGQHDQATPLDLVRETATKIPGARFAVIADAGHIPAIDQPERLAGLMADFLSEVGHG